MKDEAMVTTKAAWLLAMAFKCHSTSAFQLNYCSSQRNRPCAESQLVCSAKDGSRVNTNPMDKAGIIFPGGGLFFYWQAGVIVSIDRVKFRSAITVLPCP